MPAKRTSISGAKGAYVMTNGTFTEVYPAETNRNENAKDSLQRFIQDVGVPRDLKTDQGTELCGVNSAFRKLVNKRDIRHQPAERGRSNQMYAVNLEI